MTTGTKTTILYSKKPPPFVDGLCIHTRFLILRARVIGFRKDDIVLYAVSV